MLLALCVGGLLEHSDEDGLEEAGIFGEGGAVIGGRADWTACCVAGVIEFEQQSKTRTVFVGEGWMLRGRTESTKGRGTM